MPAKQTALVAAGATVGLTALVIFLLAWNIAGETGCLVSGESFLRPFKICSPFGSRELLPAAKYSEVLKLPLFPEARGVAQQNISWETSTEGNDLLFLEMTSASPVADVERWYENALGPTFRKSEGTCASFDLPGQEWMQRVLENCIGTGVMFLADDQTRATGVLISSPDQDRRVLRVFRYEHGNLRARK